MIVLCYRTNFCASHILSVGVITGSPQGGPQPAFMLMVGVGVIECLKVIILSVLKPDLSNNGYEATSDIVTTVGDSKVVKRQIGDCASISSKLYHSSRGHPDDLEQRGTCAECNSTAGVVGGNHHLMSDIVE